MNKVESIHTIQKDKSNSMKKFCIITFTFIFLLLINSNTIYCTLYRSYLTTLSIKNINETSNLYMLVPESYFLSNQEDNQIPTLMDSSEPPDNLVSILTNNALYIDNYLTKRLSNYSETFRKTNQFVKINGINYIEISLLKDIDFVWTHKNDILFANITNENVNIINFDNINSAIYWETTYNNCGNEVIRKAMVYNASNGKLEDTTQEQITKETEILKKISDENENKKDTMIKATSISYYILFFTIPILAGLIVELLVRLIRKNKS